MKAANAAETRVLGPALDDSARGRVARWLETEILEGRLREGRAAPSERRIAEHLGVARVTVRAAMAEAEAAGLLVRSPGGRKRLVRRRTVTPEQEALGLLRQSVVVLGDRDAPPGQAAPPAGRWSERFVSIELVRTLQEAGRHVVMLSPRMFEREQIPLLTLSRPAGVLLTYQVGEDPVGWALASACRREGIPVVVYGDHPRLAPFDRVFSDHAAGARELVGWLVSRGCRRILQYWPKPLNAHWALRRRDGYRAAVREYGLPEIIPQPLPVPVGDGSLAPKEEFDMLRRLAVGVLADFVRGPDAIDAVMVPNDHFAYPVAAALRALGRMPNRDVLVAGYDNVGPDSSSRAFEAAGPAVTIDKHNELTVRDMVALLLDRLAGRLPDEPQPRAHAHELVVTSDAPPAGGAAS